MRLPRSALAVALALCACDAGEGPIAPADPLPPANACGADDLQDLVGQPASRLETMRFSQPLRMIRPGMAVTLDYSPNRLNIELDDQDVIIRVSCG